MTMDFVIRHWALLIASVMGTAVVLFVLYRLEAESARGRLRSRVRELNAQKIAAKRAERNSNRAQQRFHRLQGRAGTVPPRQLSAADEAVQDARMLQKVADDLVLVAQRKLRDLIIEEFPPNRHDGLRNKYL
ncbi:MAG: hypothetical protein O2907_05605 [Proteobacteria bacterium]|nr:hypothetical protein [Pseudomonadota bacterium]MDA1063795.1 hypothetical protein [Pseudomonadota bacterium]